MKRIIQQTKILAFWALLLTTVFTSSFSSGIAQATSSSTPKPTVSQLQARLAPNRGLNFVCGTFHEHEPKCSFGANPDVLLWGDSFAMQLALGLKSGSHPLHFVQQTLSVCSPIFNVAPQDANGGAVFGKKCTAENNKVFDWVRRHKEIKYVILGSHWINALGTHSVLYRTGGKIGQFSKYADAQFAITLKKIESLGVKPIVVTETPTNRADHGACVTKALLVGKTADTCAFAHSSDTEIKINTKVANAAVAAGASVFWLEKLLCSETNCPAMVGNVILYRDSHHLTKEASVYLGERFNIGQRIIATAK